MGEVYHLSLNEEEELAEDRLIVEIRNHIQFFNRLIVFVDRSVKCIPQINSPDTLFFHEVIVHASYAKMILERLLEEDIRDIYDLYMVKRCYWQPIQKIHNLTEGWINRDQKGTIPFITLLSLNENLKKMIDAHHKPEPVFYPLWKRILTFLKVR